MLTCKSFNATDENKRFTTHAIPLVQGMNIYRLTVGYTDQFERTERKKLGNAHFKAKLALIANLPSTEQKKIIHQKFKYGKVLNCKLIMC